MARATESGEFIVRLTNMQILIIVSTLVLMAVFTLLIQKTSLGRAQRACEQDQKMASLLGIDVDRTISITFIMGASLAAFAGLMFFLYYGVTDFFVGFLAGIKAFTAAVLGGIGSLSGAMLGGLIIGLIETMWSAYFTSNTRTWRPSPCSSSCSSSCRRDSSASLKWRKSDHD